MGVILDTDHIVPWERSGLSARDAFHRLSLEHPGETFAISTMTIAELRHGVERAESAVRRTRRQTFLNELVDTVPLAPLNVEAAFVLGRVDAHLKKTGQAIELSDLIIGCTALALNYAVATANRAHFGRIPGLVIKNLRREML